MRILSFDFVCDFSALSSSLFSHTSDWASTMDVPSFVYGILTGLLLAVILYWVSTVFNIFRPWLQVFLSGGKASLFDIIGMRLRGSDVKLVTEAYIMLVQRGQKVSLREVESQYLARKNSIMDSRDLLQIVEQNQDSSASR
ncbi:MULTISPECIES: flotillin-like FloA family protein [Pirellulaceae]|nr:MULTISPECIES: flotillin-like FloA family protein [Pirellulaceae]RCS44482.1 hypothetical protein DTL36_22040 [Bremerella cremea]